MLPKPYYDHAGITIYCGDCRDVLPHVQADVLVTDPPYGIGYTSGWAGTIYHDSDVYGKRENGSIEGDADTSLRDYCVSAWGQEKPCLMFGSMRASFPDGWKQSLVWDKGEAAGMGDLGIPWKPNWEPIFVLGRWRMDGRSSGVLRADNIARVCMGRMHPHMKPVSLLLALLSKCPSGTVLDPFMGSGTTLVAAKQLGRRAIGIEIDEAYCRIAVQRLAQEVLPL